jgi:diacylglycerol kinase (ATP)
MTKLLAGFGYAINGFRSAVRSERNMKLHLLGAAIVVALGFYVNASLLEWSVLLLCIGGMLAAEMINTAIEEMVDLVSPGLNPKAGKVKDIAAGAVLVIATISAVVGGIILIPKLF